MANKTIGQGFRKAPLATRRFDLVRDLAAAKISMEMQVRWQECAAILLTNNVLCVARATRQSALDIRPQRRGGRVAEGGGLLNRYTV